MIIDRTTGRRIYRTLLIWAVVCLLIGTPIVRAQAQAIVLDIAVENGTVILPVVHGNEQAVTSLLQYLQPMPEFSGMTMVLLQPKGASSMVLLSGADEAKLRTAAVKLQGLLSEGGRPHRLIISAYLRELDIANNQSTGIDWSALTGNVTYGVSVLTVSYTHLTLPT